MYNADTELTIFILVTQSGLKLVQINKTDLERFRNGRYGWVQYAGRLLQTFSMENLYKEHHLKMIMIIDKNVLTVLQRTQNGI